jgi:sterol desaturase/sphingolipid hydroxylase (fatty acid hydroxylase superfamily)
LIGGHVAALLRGLPLWAAMIAEEIVLTRATRKGRAQLRGYDWRDTAASLATGLGSIVFIGAIHLGMLAVASFVYDYRIVDLGAGVLGWSVAIVGWDFVYYWHHRWEHEIRLLWAGHVIHHSSERFNYSTAFRQSWTTWPAMLLYPMLAFVGVKPGMILLSEGVNLTYQFWMHTEVVGHLPGWFQLVFNTPSHHRVHHGSNPQYVDKNYAGILMWDRLFGTFEPEAEAVVYGLSKNVHTFNPLRIVFHEYAALWRDVRGAPTWRDRIDVCVHGKSWRRHPRSLRTARTLPRQPATPARPYLGADRRCRSGRGGSPRARAAPRPLVRAHAGSCTSPTGHTGRLRGRDPTAPLAPDPWRSVPGDHGCRHRARDGTRASARSAARGARQPRGDPVGLGQASSAYRSAMTSA